MNCEDMINIPELKNVLNLKAGFDGIKNTIRWIYFADCLQCVKNEYRVEDYIHGGEFVVLTNRDVTENKERIMGLITDMVEHGIAALGINEGQILPELASYCDKENLPLFELPEKFPLVDLSQILCKRLVLEENNKNIEEQIFASILDARHLNEDKVFEQAAAVDIDLSGSFCVIEFAFDTDKSTNKDLLEVGRKLRNIINTQFSICRGLTVLVMQQTGSVLALVSTDVIKENDLRTVLEKIVDNAGKKYRIKLNVGIGSRVDYIEDVMQSRKEAAAAIKAACVAESGEHIFFYREQGVYTLISKITDEKFLDEFVDKNIGKLIDADEINNGNLCETLESFLNHNCNVKETAESLIIHRNTLNYRLNKIRELLCVDFDNLDTCLMLKLAFMIRNYRSKK